jgi:hypothetical protein
MIRKYLEIEPVCTAIDTLGTLNANCGADYVKTGQRAPPAVLAELAKTADASSAASRRACSIDGDADRVIYYYMTANGGKEGSEGKFRLLDGDKIATLAAGFIGDLVRTAGLEGQIKLGVVQTAYANGSSTAYLKGVVSASVLELSKVYPLTPAARSLAHRTFLSSAFRPASSICIMPRNDTTSASTLKPTATAPSSSRPRPSRFCSRTSQRRRTNRPR